MALPLWFGGPPDAAGSSGGSSPGDGNSRIPRAHDPIEPSVIYSDADAELLARIHQNDVQALATLARLFTPKLTAAVSGILHEEDRIKEVVQDVFVGLWERRAIVDVRESVAGYLFRSARNRALDMLRNERARKRLTMNVAAEREVEPRVAQNAGEQALELADLRAMVYAVTEQLPPLQRQVFLLHWEHELTYAEIAAALDLSAANVRQLMCRATRRLALHFPRDQGGDAPRK